MSVALLHVMLEGDREHSSTQSCTCKRLSENVCSEADWCMLQGNPSWPHKAKCDHLRRLAKDLTGPLPKRLQARAAALGF